MLYNAILIILTMRLYNLIKHYFLTWKRDFWYGFLGYKFSFKNNKKGNTTVLLPVIISLISGTVVLSSNVFDSVLAEARDTRRAVDAYQVSTALAFYYDDKDTYPVLSGSLSWQDLENRLVPDYMQALPQDPAVSEGFSYRYQSDGQKAIVFYYSEVENKEKERWVY